MKTMVKQLLLILILLPLTTFGQQTEKYVSDYASFYRAEELYEKAQYSAAREEFRGFINQFKNENDPLYVKALYYEGISALELFNNDAIPLLQAFNKKYPENIYKYIIGFKIGNYFFQKEDFLNAQVWYQKVPVNEVDKTQQEEFLFKLGYSAMQNADNETAFSAFRDAKDGKSQYAAPSLYFYSHLSYLKNSLSVALEGFLKLKSDSTFSAVVPYYIVQIYHKQAKYQEVVDFAPSVVTANELNNEADINHIIGNSHYKLGNFKEAIPYLEKYQAKAKVKRDDSYELGYCYYKTNQSEKAIKQWDKVTRVEDSLGQIAMYQIGEAYLAIDKLLPARSAFERASEMKTIPVIQEDALYNFAVISFKVDINPYDESVRAFENYLNRYPNSSRKKDVYQYLVNVYTNTSNFAKALESLDKSKINYL
jgi:tetratricopeptide (TPR) repeat protein